MLWFFLGFVLFYIGLSVVIKKNANPYKLYYIIGLKGAGKTTYMVSLMRRYLKKKKTVYTNIGHVSLPGVRFIDTKDLASFAHR